MWGILSSSASVVALPRRFTTDAIYSFIERFVNENGDAKRARYLIDFRPLQFIDPPGVVIISNLVEYLRKAECKVVFQLPDIPTQPVIYLDDSRFFLTHQGKYLRKNAHPRSTTIPLELVRSEKTYEYLYARLMPWIAENVGMSTDSLSTVRACLEEVFHNIQDHSGVSIGCSFAQHFPNLNEIHIAVSDFGYGIPRVVGKKAPGLSDQAAIAKACEEGFTTKSNVRNRGAGLPTLLNYVTGRNRGTVLISAGRGRVSAVPADSGMKVTARRAPGFYPGTLITTILRTDTIEAIAEDVLPEEFKW